jgi:hypothetical protein
LVVFNAYDSLTLSTSKSLRAYFALAKALTAADRVVFSSDSACCDVTSCAARAIVQYSQELVKDFKGIEVAKERRGTFPIGFPILQALQEFGNMPGGVPDVSY